MRYVLVASLLVLACRQRDEGSGTKAVAAATASTGAAPVVLAPPPPELKPGDPAPDVILKLQDGKQVALSSLRGKYVVLYFYPKDETSGCTVEAESLRDSWKTLQAFDTEVFGVSVQDAASHREFIASHQLPFSLVVDTDHEVMSRFGVPLKGELAARQTFLISPEGMISTIWRNVDPAKHAQEILDAVANR